MDKAEKRHVEEMERLKIAIVKTDSKCLKRDYTKALRRMENELKEYRRYKYAN